MSALRASLLTPKGVSTSKKVRALTPLLTPVILQAKQGVHFVLLRSKKVSALTFGEEYVSTSKKVTHFVLFMLLY